MLYVFWYFVCLIYSCTDKIKAQCRQRSIPLEKQDDNLPYEHVVWTSICSGIENAFGDLSDVKDFRYLIACDLFTDFAFIEYVFDFWNLTDPFRPKLSEVLRTFKVHYRFEI
jgi:hypothetical protein